MEVREQRFVAFVPPGHLISFRVNPATQVARFFLEFFRMINEELFYQPRIDTSLHTKVHRNFPCKDIDL